MDHKIVEIVPPGPVDSPRAHWPLKLRREFDENQFSGAVGNVLVSETDDVRVWHLSLPPGGWLTFHRHVLDYFWTTTTAGVARGYYQDGRIADVYHYPGETRHFVHNKDEFFVHGIKNVGDTKIGDTVTEADRPTDKALPGFEELKPMVFAGLYPTEANQYGDLRDAIEKLRLNDATSEPAAIDPFAHLVTANVQGLGQQRYCEPFPALADAEAQPVQHRTNGCRGTAEDSRGFFDRNGVHQFDQTLLLPRGPLAITALFGHAEPTHETQASVAWIS